MAGDRFKRVAAGEKLKITSSTWNAVLDATQAVINSKNDGGSTRPGGLPDGLIMCRNDSGSDVDRFNILGFDDVAITPDENENGFLQSPIITGVTPTTAANAGNFVVTAEPIKSGKIGWAFVFGVCPVVIDVGAATDGFADVKNGSRTELASATTGAAQILWTESGGTGSMYAIIRFGGGDGIPAPTARYQVYTPIDDTLIPIWTYARFM